MRKLRSSDKIWNRACFGGGESPRPGDNALSALLLFHGLVLNGGLLYAIDCLSRELLAAAKDGYIFYGFKEMEELISSAEDAIENNEDLDVLEQSLDKKYWDLVPADEVLVKSFERHQKKYPFAYSPVIENESKE